MLDAGELVCQAESLINDREGTESEEAGDREA